MAAYMVSSSLSARQSYAPSVRIAARAGASPVAPASLVRLAVGAIAPVNLVGGAAAYPGLVKKALKALGGREKKKA